MKKVFSIVVAVIWLCAMPVLAQEGRRPRFNVEEFKAKQEAYIAQKADLTSSEAEKVFPVFQEMKTRQFELMKKIQKLKQKGEEQMDSEKDYLEALTKMAELNIECAKLESEYYKKITKVVSAKKAYRIRMADDSFHREMLQSFNGRSKENHTKKNHTDRSR